MTSNSKSSLVAGNPFSGGVSVSGVDMAALPLHGEQHSHGVADKAHALDPALRITLGVAVALALKTARETAESHKRIIQGRCNGVLGHVMGSQWRMRRSSPLRRRCRAFSGM